MQTKIEVYDGKIQIVGPYSDLNNQVYRELGGKFNRETVAWELPDNETSRQKIAELFGTKSPVGEYLVPVSHKSVVGKQTLQIGGYVLASRKGRDWPVKFADGVSLYSGEIPSSGGSVKNPRVDASFDTVFRLKCRSVFAEAHGLQPVPDNVTVEI